MKQGQRLLFFWDLQSDWYRNVLVKWVFTWCGSLMLMRLIWARLRVISTRPSARLKWAPVIPPPQNKGKNQQSRKSSGCGFLQHVSDRIPFNKQPVNCRSGVTVLTKGRLSAFAVFWLDRNMFVTVIRLWRTGGNTARDDPRWLCQPASSCACQYVLLWQLIRVLISHVLHGNSPPVA